MEAELTLAYDKLCCPAYTQVPGTIHLALPSDEELEKWIKDIYKNSDKAGLHIPTVKAYADKFWQAVQEGYGRGFEEVDWDSPDADMLKHLATNVYTFSAAKNNAELKAITSKIVDENGKVRSFAQFRKEAAKITDTFQGSWLEAEYELAVAGGQMASKWVEFERTGDDTMLRYSTVKDARVSDICKPLEGVTKPITDGFWNTYYPPNHFRCRCDVNRIPYNTKATPEAQTPAPEVPKMLQVNLAKEKLVFPKSHPYYTTALPASDSNIPANLYAYEKKYGIEVNKELFELHTKPVNFVNKTYKTKGAFFDPNKNLVNIPLDKRRKESKWYSEAVVYHEFGHAADFHRGMRSMPEIKDLMEKYRSKFSDNKNELYKKLDDALTKIVLEAKSNKQMDLYEQAYAGMDTLMSLNPRYGAGHTVTYFSRSGAKEAEFIAHMFENKYAGNEIFKREMPELYDDMIKTADLLIDKIKLTK